MNYNIRLEARGSKGKEEVLEALRQLPYGILDQRVRVSTVVDDIVIREDIASLSVPAHLQ